MSFLAKASYWYWAVALIISLYHCYRGARWQWILGKKDNEEKKWNFQMSKTEIVFLRCIEDGFFYLVCSVAGFLSLLAANHFYESFAQSQTGDISTSALIAFLFTIGIIGVSGQLPYVILLGKVSVK